MDTLTVGQGGELLGDADTHSTMELTDPLRGQRVPGMCKT